MCEMGTAAGRGKRGPLDRFEPVERPASERARFQLSRSAEGPAMHRPLTFALAFASQPAAAPHGPVEAGVVPVDGWVSVPPARFRGRAAIVVPVDGLATALVPAVFMPVAVAIAAAAVVAAVVLVP